nr:hypothetical protein [Tanacetum cinerariifolium]
MCDEFAKIMHDEFETSMMGELNFFLQLQIKQMEDDIFFNQSKYIKEMLKKLGLEDSKPMKTPMSSDTKLTKDEECELVDSTMYRGMIGSLLYLTASRPDIMFSVRLCARFQEALKTSHLEAVKGIFRYIKGTTHLGLWYPKGTGIETVVYADSDHAEDYVDRKSTSGICTFVGCCLTSWFSKKQTALAISTIEAEYVSAGKACQQALWMKQALIDYDVRFDDVPIMCDNKGAIELSKNLVQHSRTKHIEIRYHFLRDNVQKGHISIEKVSSVENIANILTKPLKHEPTGQDLAFNVDNVFQADACDAFDSDVDEAPTSQTMFMVNLSSAYPIYDEAGLLYDSDILSEVPDHENYQDVVCEHHEVHEMHDNVQPHYVVDSHVEYTNDSNMINKKLLMQAQENGVTLDEEQLLFIAGGQDNAVDEDVDEPTGQDLAFNVDNVFQADACDAFDSDVDEAPTSQTI